MSSIPEKLPGVSVATKANVYFDGKVVSHSVFLPNGAKKTLGLIYPGAYHFNTTAAEIMEIVAGSCRVTLDGEPNITRDFPTGAEFHVPANSGFTIGVKAGICEYICTFIG